MDKIRVAVLGAGTMGARIAAHLANAGVPSFLVDIVSANASNSNDPSQRNAIAAAGLAEGVPVFRRFQVMQSWDETGVIPVRAALADDRLHMNDRSYGCLARLLADDIATAAR